MALDITAHRIAQVRTGAGYVLLIASALWVVTGVFITVAVLVYQVSGKAIAGYTPDELEWGDLGSTLLGCLILTPLSLWGAYTAFPEDDADIEAEHPASSAQGEGSAEKPRPLENPAPAPATSHRHTKWSRLREAELIRRAVQRDRDEQIRALVNSNPDVGTAVMWMVRLLDEQEAVDQRHRTKDKRRDVILLGVGTVLGVIAPVASAPAVRLLPH